MPCAVEIVLTVEMRYKCNKIRDLFKVKLYIIRSETKKKREREHERDREKREMKKKREREKRERKNK